VAVPEAAHAHQAGSLERKFLKIKTEKIHKLHIYTLTKLKK